MPRPTIDQLRQHPWVVKDYVMAQPRDPVPKSGTDNDLFEPTVDPKALSKVSRRTWLQYILGTPDGQTQDTGTLTLL